MANYQKKYEELTFTDDFMFGKVMSNNLELCREHLLMSYGSREGLSVDMTAFLDYLLKKPASDKFTKAIEKDVISAREHN